MNNTPTLTLSRLHYGLLRPGVESPKVPDDVETTTTDILQAIIYEGEANKSPVIWIGELDLTKSNLENATRRLKVWAKKAADVSTRVSIAYQYVGSFRR